MADTLAPNPANYTKGGAIVMFQRDGATGFLDLGNIPDFTPSIAAQYVEHKTARSGVLITDRKEQTEAAFSIKIGADELNNENMALIMKSTAPAAFSQASGTNQTKTIASPTLGLKYSLDAYRVTAVAVTVSAAAKTLGVDYTIDADLGMIRFLPGGSIQATDTVTVTFSKPVITGNVIAPQSKVGMITGQVRVFFRASDGRLMIFKHTKNSLSFDGDLNMGGSEFAKGSATITFDPDYAQTYPYGTIESLPAA